MRAREGPAGGGRGDSGLTYRDKRWRATVAYSFVDPEFSPTLGYPTFVNRRGMSASGGYSTEYRRGPLRSVFVGCSRYRNLHYGGAFFEEQDRFEYE